jgi:hypothetical protein
MIKCLRYGAIALAYASLAYASSVHWAAAQSGFPGGAGDPQSKAMIQPSQLRLTPAQRTAILNAVLAESAKITPPPKFQASVGGQVPPSIELRTLPSAAMAQAPELRSLQYTMSQNQVLLVDPTTMRVIDIIRQ